MTPKTSWSSTVIPWRSGGLCEGLHTAGLCTEANPEVSKLWLLATVRNPAVTMILDKLSQKKVQQAAHMAFVESNAASKQARGLLRYFPLTLRKPQPALWCYSDLCLLNIKHKSHERSACLGRELGYGGGLLHCSHSLQNLSHPCSALPHPETPLPASVPLSWCPSATYRSTHSLLPVANPLAIALAGLSPSPTHTISSNDTSL